MAERELLLGRLEVAQHHTDSTGHLRTMEDLLQVARRNFGDDDPLVFLIRCGIEEVLSQRRDVAASAKIWGELRERATAALPAEDTTLMSIRAYEAQYVRRRGGVGDVELGIQLYSEELRLRTKVLGEDDHRTSIIRANLAYALRERGTNEDLMESMRLLRQEVEHRIAKYNNTHDFTALAWANLARTLIRLHETSAPPHESYPDGYAAAVLRIAGDLVQTQEDAAGAYARTTLCAYLLRSYALRLHGRDDEADRDLRFVQAAVNNRRIAIGASWHEFLHSDL